MYQTQVQVKMGLKLQEWASCTASILILQLPSQWSNAFLCSLVPINPILSRRIDLIRSEILTIMDLLYPRDSHPVPYLRKISIQLLQPAMHGVGKP